MTRFFRPNGSALLTLVAALLLATWPFFGTFTIGTLIAGSLPQPGDAVVEPPSPEHRRRPGQRPVHSEINLASIPVRGDGAGLLFAVGSVAILLALPQLRWFLIASVACSIVAGA